MRPLILVWLTACCVYAEMPYHPYRKVEGKYYNVQPIYDWLRLAASPRQNLTSKQAAQLRTRPMKAWRISARGDAYVSVSFEVEQVLNDILIIRRAGSHYAYPGRVPSYEKFALRNYPERQKVTDRQRIDFIALKVGTFQRGRETLELYDYGTPYDPSELEKTLQLTNARPQSKTNRPPPANAAE